MDVEEVEHLRGLLSHRDFSFVNAGLELMDVLVFEEADLQAILQYPPSWQTLAQLEDGMEFVQRRSIALWTIGKLAEIGVSQALELTEIDLSFKYRTSIFIPDNLSNLPNLRSVVLHNHRLEHFPEVFCDIRTLQTLSVTSAEIKELPHNIGQLKELKKLILDNNALTELPASIGSLSALEELSVAHNKLTTMPFVGSQLQQLTSCNLVYNPLQTWPEELIALKIDSEQWSRLYKSLPPEPLLRHFVLEVYHHHSDTHLPEIGKLTNIQSLRINGGRFVVFPHSILNLKQLRRLEIRSRHLRYLPEGIGEFTTLELLDVEHTNLRQLPANFSKLLDQFSIQDGMPTFACTIKCPEHLHAVLTGHKIKALAKHLPDEEAQKVHRLNIANAKFGTLPEDLKRFVNLRYLDASGNDLVDLPDWLFSFAQVEQLNLNNNDLTAVPDEIGLLTQLRELNLGRNRIKEIPIGLCRLAQLAHLDVQKNKIVQLPEEFQKLQSLRYLNLNKNKFRWFPASIPKLSSLRQLYFKTHRVTSVPDELFSLRNLTHLDLGGNRLPAIPDQIANLSNLEHLDINGNRYPLLPAAVQRLEKLTFLGINSQYLTQLPDWFFHLLNDVSIQGNEHSYACTIEIDKKLRSDLAYHQFRALCAYASPEQIRALTKLSYKRRGLTALPPEIGNLKQLRSLRLEENHIAELPQGLTDLSNLQFLALDDNQLVELPSFLKDLPNDVQIRLPRNPLSERSLTWLTEHLEADIWGKSTTRATSTPASKAQKAFQAQRYLVSTLLKHADHRKLQSGLLLLTQLAPDEDSLRAFLQIPAQCNAQQPLFDAIRLHTNRRFLFLWTLSRFAELQVPWAMSTTKIDVDLRYLREIPRNLLHLTQLSHLDLRRTLLPPESVEWLKTTFPNANIVPPNQPSA